MSELRVPMDGADLAVTYTPADGTAVVALHGASAGTRDFHLYQHLHAILPPIGVGVATFDRRGEGASSGESSVGRFGVQAQDALAVADAVGVERIGLWGFSQGGWVAPLAAGMSSRVAFMVLIASTGVTPAEQMRFATAEQLRRAGFSAAVIRRAVALRQACEDWIHAPDEEAATTLSAELDAASREPWWELAFLGTELPDANGRAAWIEEMDVDPEPIFAATRVPTLLFYGADDEWSPVDASVRAWRRARPDGVEVEVIPGAAHDLTLPDGRLGPAYEKRLLRWLAARLSE